MMSIWEFKKRWNCPTDRELILRSKINVGWSIHSANVFMKTERFEINELQAIERVIQRAADLERLEVERVGRMVCKLENMTRNALGDGEKTCSMCGITFGIFRSSFVKCVDCGKAVCEKCRVDTLTASLDICMLCKICSENREVWKKSGGWFYGKLPTKTEDSKKECESKISGSPNPARAFDTWSHRAPDIVRLQSYEPPAENHNDHSNYTNWTISPDKTDLSTCEDSDDSEKNQSDYSQYASEDSSPVKLEDSVPKRVRSVPNFYFGENEDLPKERHSDGVQDDLTDSTIPDSLIDKKTQSSFELETPRKRSDEHKQLNVPAQRTKFIYLTPTNLQEPSKLRRKASIRRKRSSAPTQGHLEDK